jgi:hypothetical protein
VDQTLTTNAGPGRRTADPMEGCPLSPVPCPL